MRAPEERHQGAKSDAAPLELITLSIRYYKHWAPPEPRMAKLQVAGSSLVRDPDLTVSVTPRARLEPAAPGPGE